MDAKLDVQSLGKPFVHYEIIFEKGKHFQKTNFATDGHIHLLMLLFLFWADRIAISCDESKIVSTHFFHFAPSINLGTTTVHKSEQVDELMDGCW